MSTALMITSSMAASSSTTTTRLSQFTCSSSSIIKRHSHSDSPHVLHCRPRRRNFNDRFVFGIVPRRSISKSRAVSPVVMEWQDCKVKLDVDIPAAVAYKIYLDREAMPKWIPFISSVEVLKDKPEMSRWSLKYEAFGRDIEFSWLARNLQPIPNQKIHWVSEGGLPNRGAVRFYPRGPSSSAIELTVSYELPQVLVPVASALQPFLEGLLVQSLERFAEFAKSSEPDFKK
ncbi:hypothetical protein Droror1_Dr00022302 [Drosera rotundifolia]